MSTEQRETLDAILRQSAFPFQKSARSSGEAGFHVGQAAVLTLRAD